MFGLGMSEIVVLAVIGLIVIGPKELPELARTVGRFLNELKRSTEGLTEDFKNQVRLDRLDNFNSISHPETNSSDEVTNSESLTDHQLSFQDHPHGHGLDSEYHQSSAHPSDESKDPEQLELLAEDIVLPIGEKEVKKT